eukprot:63816-Pyramimonas_sp.AAC.1
MSRLHSRDAWGCGSSKVLVQWVVVGDLVTSCRRYRFWSHDGFRHWRGHDRFIVAAAPARAVIATDRSVSMCRSVVRLVACVNQ